MEAKMQQMQNDINLSYLRFLRKLVDEIDREIKNLEAILSGKPKPNTDGSIDGESVIL